MEYTKGKWELVYDRNICTGVCVDRSDNGAYKYVEIICDSILPDTDEEYEKQEKQIIANMTLISKAPEMYEALKGMVETYSDILRQNHPEAKINIAKSLLKELDQ